MGTLSEYCITDYSQYKSVQSIAGHWACSFIVYCLLIMSLSELLMTQQRASWEATVIVPKGPIMHD